MIKLISAFTPPQIFDLKPGDTTETINQRMIQATKENFRIDLQETQVGRILPRDEPIFDNREYYVNFTKLPFE